jgi:hypothetical protein
LQRFSVIGPFLCRCGIILDAGTINPLVDGFWGTSGGLLVIPFPERLY